MSATIAYNIRYITAATDPAHDMTEDEDMAAGPTTKALEDRLDKLVEKLDGLSDEFRKDMNRIELAFEKFQSSVTTSFKWATWAAGIATTISMAAIGWAFTTSQKVTQVDVRLTEYVKTTDRLTNSMEQLSRTFMAEFASIRKREDANISLEEARKTIHELREEMQKLRHQSPTPKQ